MKKIFITIIAMLLPLLVSADAVEIDGINYILDSSTNTATVTCKIVLNPYATGLYSGSVVIPSEVTYNGSTYNVTSIGSNAFSWSGQLESVTIPNSVTSIGSCAFEGCEVFHDIVIGKNVKSVGSSAFSGCHNITNVISMIEDPFYMDLFDQLYDYDNLKLIVPKGTKAKYEAIYGRDINNNNIIEYDKKKSIHVSTAGTLPNLLQDYEKRLIEELTLTGNLNGTDIACIRRMAGAPVNYYYSGSQYGGKKESGYTYGNLSVLNISNATIVSGGDPYIKQWNSPEDDDEWYVNTSNSYTSNNAISSRMFSDCKLTKVYLPSYVTSIGTSAFDDCSGLNSITIPNSVRSIGLGAFNGCSGLTSIVSKIKKPFVFNNSVFNSNIYSTATLTVPYDTKSLYESTAGWNQFQNVVEVDPIDVTVIYEKDFTGITEFTGWSQFAEEQTDGKVGVDPTGVAITVGVQTGQLWQPQVMVIPDGSFDLEVDGYYRVVITAKFPTDGTLMINMGSWSANDQSQFPVKSTGDFQTIVCDFEDWSMNAENAHLLYQCGDFKGTTIVKKIQVIYMGDTVIPFSIDNICYKLFTKDKTAKVISNPQKYFGEVTIPSTIIYKGEEYSVTAIDNNAFYNCTNLTSVTIPNSVTSIGRNAFYGCNNLQFICLTSDKYPSNYGLGTTNAQFIMPQTAFEGGIPQDIKNYATYGVTPMYIKVKSTTATSATLELTPIDITSGKSNGATTYETKVFNMKPGAAVNGSWELADKDRGVVSIPTVYTKSLVMTVQPAIPLSTVKARLSATINEPDDDKHYGFEWLRNDAPSNMTPYQVPAQLYNGKIVGSLSNLNPDIYYKYRPFYKTDDGTVYRGGWEAFNTGDANVVYEPEVYTKDATNVSPNGAIISGVFTDGTNDAKEGGFEYSLTESSTRGNDVIKVVLSGNNTSVSINGLEPGTKYAYRAYMKTASGTIYGEYKTFKTLLMGDANDDGKVNVADVVEVVNAKAGKASASFKMNNADMDGNGSLTEADITAIVNKIMQK